MPDEYEVDPLPDGRVRLRIYVLGRLVRDLAGDANELADLLEEPREWLLFGEAERGLA